MPLSETFATKPSRRRFTVGAAAAAAGVVLGAEAALGQDQAQAWQLAVRKIMGEAKPSEGKITLELPEIAENGNTVPFSVLVESPMTEKEHVKAIHMISTANPEPTVATFGLTPLSGKAAVSSRMRLARTQDVISIAELSDGRFLMAKRSVKVTIGGCGG
jgi:sulfur-oxidizing protein SoxY